ncbi:MAG: 4Fe-4S dicluster domain-containing protein [Armatimonadota bacterium]
MAEVIINAEQCKACMLCIEFCPRDCLALGEQLNSRGFHAAAWVNAEGCSGCGICALMCPDVCIEIHADVEAVAK